VGFYKQKESKVKIDGALKKYALHAGESTGFDGVKGKFVIEDADKTGASFRTKGRLKYDGTRYLKYTDTNEPFLKGGADSPENFLGYYELHKKQRTSCF